MFHVDVTCEDLRLVATGYSKDSNSFDCVFYDNHSGKHWEKTIDCVAVGQIIAIMLDADGRSKFTTIDLLTIEALFADCPVECRPIP